MIVVCGGVRPSRIVDRDALTIDGIDWSSPEEGASPTTYRIKDAAEPYIVVTLPHSVVPVTALGPLVDALKNDALNAGRSPSATPG